MSKLKNLLLMIAAVVVPDAVWMFFSSKALGQTEFPVEKAGHDDR